MNKVEFLSDANYCKHVVHYLITIDQVQKSKDSQPGDRFDGQETQ